MLGTRTAIISLVSLYVTATATFVTLSGQQVRQTVSADHTVLEQRLDQAIVAETEPETLFAELRQQLPLRYGFVRHREEATQSVFGSYQEPNHYLAPLFDLFPSELRLEKTIADQDFRLQLDGNQYLRQAEQTLLPALTVVSAAFLLTLVLVFWRTIVTQRKLRILQNGIERLPSMELPSSLNRLSGRLTPLADAVHHTCGQLKDRLVKLSRASQVLQHPVLDPVTSLKSRALFNEEMERPANAEALSGHLVLVRAAALAELNERLGQTGGDRYLTEIAIVLKHIIKPFQSQQAEVYRYGATDFLIKLPQVTTDATKTLINSLGLQLSELAKHQEVENAGAVGAISYQQGDRISQLLTNLDTAISMAESQGAHGHYLMDNSLAELGLDSERWQGVIEDVIENGRLYFIHQKIRPTREEDRLYTEMLVRFKNEDDHPLPTEATFGMAARYGLATDLDKMIITHLLRELTQDSEGKEAYGINLANHSFSDAAFMSWLEHRIQDVPQLANRLVFEISERSIQNSATQATAYIERLHRLGVRICIDRFGTALTSFRFFQMLKPDYIKLGPDLTRDIESNPNNRFFIKMLLEIAMRLQIKVIATHVERSDEKVALEELKVHGLQGHHIAMPKPLHQVRA
ncbi:EAL domain-containing protein [Marinobacter hydrocarbonoclasticus]|nr:EAL domain-containing protein [Marinobacter nauticus]